MWITILTHKTWRRPIIYMFAVAVARGGSLMMIRELTHPKSQRSKKVACVFIPLFHGHQPTPSASAKVRSLLDQAVTNDVVCFITLQDYDNLSQTFKP